MDMEALLTPDEVKDLLKISIRTVYDRARDLGGFYPAGIGVLRFDPEVLYDILERSKSRPLAVSVPVQGGELLREGFPDSPRVRRSRGRAQKNAQGSKEDNPFRHGLRLRS